MALVQDVTIDDYQHEKSRPREAEALYALRKIASLVKPIMRQRGWKVGTLAEFYPDENNLLGLNINRGQKILIRLRHAQDEKQFLRLEEVVDTMLHELCHIVWGDHDGNFHNLWDELRDEYEALIRKGYTGEGFLSQGYTLGGRRIPKDEARRLARANAEKRRTLTAGSGQKLGGAPIRRGQDIRQVIADAATRRAKVMQGCASSRMNPQRERELVEKTNKNGFKTKARDNDANEEAMMIEYIDLVQEEKREKYGRAYVPPSRENPAGSRGAPIEVKPTSGSSHWQSRPRPDDDIRRTLDESGWALSHRKPQTSLESETHQSSSKVRSKSGSSSHQRSRTLPEPEVCQSATRPKPKSEMPSKPSHPRRELEKRHAAPPIPTSTKPTSKRPVLLASSDSEPLPAPRALNGSWTCEICTLVNPSTYLCCDACATERPTPPSSPTSKPKFDLPSTQTLPSSVRDSNAKKAIKSLMSLETTISQQPKKPLAWSCHRCQTWTEAEWWTCAGCGSMKLSS